MKKKTFSTILIACLAAFMLLNPCASAAEIRSSDYLAGYSASAAKTRDGDLSILCNVIGTQKMDSIGVNRIEIQRYNGSRWTTEKTYTSSDLSDLQADNVMNVSGRLVHTPKGTGSYRALVTVFAKDGSGSDERVVTTTTVII